MSVDLLDPLTVDRVAIALGRAEDRSLREVLVELRVASNRALWSEGPDEALIERARALSDRARQLASSGVAWRIPPVVGLHLDRVRSFSGSIGVHYGTLEGRSVVLKSSREPVGERLASELFGYLGVPAPVIGSIEADRVIDAMPDLGSVDEVQVQERVEGFDLRQAPLVGFTLDPGDLESLEALGFLAAVDVAIGNPDRFASGNRGNLMIDRSGRFVAIDTEATFSTQPALVQRALGPEGGLDRTIEAFFGIRVDPAGRRAIQVGARRGLGRLREVGSGEPGPIGRVAQVVTQSGVLDR